MLNKKLLAVAIVGTLVAGNAAAANLSASGGAIPAILMRVPGTPASVATVLDGYKMTQQGKAAYALQVALRPRQRFACGLDRGARADHLGAAGAGGVRHARDQRFVLRDGDRQRIGIDAE